MRLQEIMVALASMEVKVFFTPMSRLIASQGASVIIVREQAAGMTAVHFLQGVGP